MSSEHDQNIYKMIPEMSCSFVDLPQTEYKFPANQLESLIIQYEKAEESIKSFNVNTSDTNDFKLIPYLSEYLLEAERNIRKVYDGLRKAHTTKAEMNEFLMNFKDFLSNDDIDRLFYRLSIYKRSKETIHIIYNKLLVAFTKNSDFKGVVIEKNDKKQYITIFTLSFIDNIAFLGINCLDFNLTDEVYDIIYDLYAPNKDTLCKLHPTSVGKICPIETPEGRHVGITKHDIV
jgi:hypothetical protein